MSEHAFAQTQIMLPQQQGPSTSGLTVGLSVPWQQTAGYFPIKVEVQSNAGPVAADRVLLVEFVPRHGRGMSKVSQVVELREGSSTAEVTVLMPQQSSSFLYGVDVWEDGQQIKDLSANLGILLNRSQNPGLQGMSMLLVGSEPGLAGLHSNFRMSFSNSTSMMSDSSVAHDLPTRWIDYSGLDIVCMSATELANVASTNPGALRAIRQWTLSGGNLWIFDVGANWERLQEVDNLLDISLDDGTIATPEQRGWSGGDKASYAEWQGNLGQSSSGYAVGISEAVLRPSMTPLPNAEPPKFLQRRFGQGMLLALPDIGPNNNMIGQWSYVLLQLDPERMNWAQRHGLVLNEYNADFWNLMIPGVGLPPVTGFQVLITLFVLVIGPLNFYLLRRWNQLKMLLITVPVGAALVTAILLGYALLADGLSVKARVRSLTTIDQRTGDTVTWSRQSYYAGVAPSDPLLFPHDTVVYPLESDSNRRRRSIRRRDWHWDEDGQHLAGWLPTRTPVQLLAISSRNTGRRIDVASATSGPPTVTNLLGAEIEQLVLVDDKGNFYETSDMPEGESTELAAANSADAKRLLRTLFHDNSPENLAAIGVPPGVVINSYPAYGGINQSNSLLELGLSEPEMLGPREYIAILRRSPEVTLGLDPVVEEASFHVIKGRW